MISFQPSKLEPNKIEPKWQKYWEESGLFKAVDFQKSRKKFYHLVMFPYPSGDLHIGHWYNFAPADIYARYKYLQGYNVLSPIGFDAFGLPAENAAIKYKKHPKDWIDQNISHMRKQLQSIGAIYDWSREINTSEPKYYKWTQWIFLQLYQKGLAYRDKVLANWCPKDQTVLANEQVIDGKCERCGTVVIQKLVEQWLFKITDYAERLLKNLEKLDWPEKTKTMQRNWIGKSEGALIKFEIRSTKSETNSKLQIQNSKQFIEVFTTRPDTIFGATYMVLAPEHNLIEKLKTKIENLNEIREYLEKTKRKSELERTALEKEKTGVELKGIKAINPATGKEIPIWIADYVLAIYGTGAIMAVPAHDNRDFEFASKFNLPIKQVITPARWQSDYTPEVSKAYEEDGVMVESGQFTGLRSKVGKKKVIEYLKQKGVGKPKTEYHLHDWIISRQRYWGVPIPIIHCDNCGIQAVLEKDLPVLLPKVADFRPKGKSPLATNSDFVNTTCHNCGGKAKRETDTLDTFVDSSWYFLRYIDPQNDEVFADEKLMNYWLPVDIYIGGAEHTVMHLLYARFITMVLYDLKLIPVEEPFPKLRHQGIILGSDRQKMSKSRGNVIDPDELVAKYGADAVRMFLAFMGPYDQGGPWNTSGILGIVRYLKRIFESSNKIVGTTSDRISKKLHQTIKKVSDDIENLHFNTAISTLMEFQNTLEEEKYKISKDDFQKYLIIFSPFAPHLSEEIYQKIGNKNRIVKNPWPKYDPQKISEDRALIIIQINGKLRDRIEVRFNLSQEELKKESLKSTKVQSIIGQNKKSIKKTVYIKNKLINFVI